MKHIKSHLCIGMCLFYISTFAQLDSIQRLDEVVLTDRQLQLFSVGQTLQDIPESRRVLSYYKLSDLLLDNTTLHIRQNSYGGVASVSFRGTTAQQTAVVWNGININSQFNGQTDFNSISSFGYNDMSIRPGGGSLLYGSGAIGGSIHLNNKLYFRDTTKIAVFSNYSSFNTLENFAQLKLSSEKSSLYFNFNRSASDNDYPIIRDNSTNLNGQFEQWSVQLSYAQKISKHSQLTYHGQYNDGLRHFSIRRPSENKSNYTNTDVRNLLEWEYEAKSFTSVLKYAYLFEAFEYNQNILTDLITTNQANRHLFKHELYKTTSAFDFNFNTAIERTTANGDNIQNQNIDHLKFSGLVNYNPNWATLSLGLRQEFSNFYDSPILYTLGLKLPITSIYFIKLSHSKNFRQPTLNDLFWVSGSQDLQPEEALQYEFNHKLNFKSARLSLNISTYYNAISQMIRWIPNETAIWTPENVDQVNTFGLSASVSKAFDMNQFKINTNLSYDFTRAENKLTNKQLTYTPQHSALLSLDLNYKKFKFNIIQSYKGSSYVRTDNNPNFVLDQFWLTQLNLSYQLPRLSSIEFNIGAKNLFNQAYQTIENRPMPGRQLYINSLINL